MVNPVSECLVTEYLRAHSGIQLETAVFSETDVDLPKHLFEFMWSNKNRYIQADLAKAIFDAGTEAAFLEREYEKQHEDKQEYRKEEQPK